MFLIGIVWSRVSPIFYRPPHENLIDQSTDPKRISGFKMMIDHSDMWLWPMKLIAL
jgi:hypothetical protein